MDYKITILPKKITLLAPDGSNLLDILRANNLAPDAPCGGKGKCGKCTVTVNGKKQLACQTAVCGDITVELGSEEALHILSTGVQRDAAMNPIQDGYLLAVDIGTTSVVCFLLDGKTGAEVASASMRNPQTVFGADVISRIQAALGGALEEESTVIRNGLSELISDVCKKAGIQPEEIGVICPVGNPAMQQLFLGLSPKNLSAPPFSPILTKTEVVPGKTYLSLCPNAQLLVIPDISGYVGADTMGCVLSTGMYEYPEITLMVDIGTNGEMVLGNRDRMIACSTAAGPALEGANIHFGMRGTNGAIDHVWQENGSIQVSVIGGGSAKGICGSGLLDAVAVALDMGLLNKRGRILSSQEVDGQRVIYLTEDVYLTQDDIRQVQLAKGAIHAGIELMAGQIGIHISDIHQVLLAGAFGTFLNPASACRIGLLPELLKDRITAVGNAAGSGAKLLACSRDTMALCQRLRDKIEFIELASLPTFSKTFALSMSFREAGK